MFMCNTDILKIEIIPQCCIFIGLVQRKISFAPYPREIKGSLRKVFANDISSMMQLVFPKFDKRLSFSTCSILPRFAFYAVS